MAYDKTGLKTPQDYGDGWGSDQGRALTSQEVHENFKWAAQYTDVQRGSYYYRSSRWLAKSESARTTIVPPPLIEAEVNGTVYRVSALADIDISNSSAWDTTSGTDYTVASNRAGMDFYIYACEPSSGSVPDLVLSANSTVPDGYTASNSRKIGGFHCLCADVATDTYDYVNSSDDLELVDELYESHSVSGTQHWLEGYVEGDILPASIWDLVHRPRSRPEGMVYDPGADLWVDIYLASWDGSRLVSAYGATIADGESTPAFHKAKFGQHFARQKKRLPIHDEFQSLSLGSPQGVNIAGDSDPGTTGGHDASDGKRIVSLIGAEDATGVLWQWGNGQASASRSSWGNGYTSEDDNVAGEDYSNPNRPRFGGHWGHGAVCGSRGATWKHSALYLYSNVGARGVAEPYGGRA